MEQVRHYVGDSGNTTVRGFLASEAVDFDPPSDSLRQNVKKANVRSVYELADGSTDDDDENEIRDRMCASQNSYELIRMFQIIDRWEGLDDELPEGHLDQIAANLAQVLDQKLYEVYGLIRRYRGILDYASPPTLGDCVLEILRLPSVHMPGEIDRLLARKDAVLGGIASVTMRERVAPRDAARVIPQVIQACIDRGPHRVNELVALLHEANYTTRICAPLARLDYRPLYDVITDMVNPDPLISNTQRTACRDACLRLQPEFAAARDAVDDIGPGPAKATVNRFTAALKAALDNFPTSVPAPGVISAIAAAIGGVASTVADLITTVQSLPDELGGSLTLASLLNSSGDDTARQLVGKLNSQNTLGHLSFGLKLELLNALLDGFTVDDDENAINLILTAARNRDQAEVYQLVSAAGWEALDTSVDGEQYEELETTLNDLN
ncbi:hypothetical protein [Microbacterium terricola]|uniref:Uncharacterized protein n=1 Tax=Microbacterium terricola TaxID=344163 RepID=A0ABM8E0Z8_9MICO|nr:hypothetical protein [Microbacterium terricola]UYK40822.1 hypothetical protein OAU46_04010 [Microbacterium terricola]BDV31430.1 hypothetical protein Microterr_20900 [Microbacterium terricola]